MNLNHNSSSENLNHIGNQIHGTTDILSCEVAIEQLKGLNLNTTEQELGELYERIDVKVREEFLVYLRILPDGHASPRIKSGLYYFAHTHEYGENCQELTPYSILAIYFGLKCQQISIPVDRLTNNANRTIGQERATIKLLLSKNPWNLNQSELQQIISSISAYMRKPQQSM